jgi:hypothetical protein
MNIKHLSWSFWASLTALSAGLLALLSGVYLAIQGDTGVSSQLSVIGGVLTEFIGAGFFFLYTRNLKQLNIFYNQLVKHQDVLYAISLSRELPNDESLKKSIIGKLLSTNEPQLDPEVFKALIAKQN